MIKIVICDDEKIFLERLEGKITAYLEARKLSFQIESFCGGEELLNGCEEKIYDFAFLDINIGSVNGIDIAHRLQEVNKRLCIVFVTGYMDYVLEGYKVGAIRYLVKESLDDRFEECMEAMLKKLHIDAEEICLELSGGKVYMAAEDICYVESKGHKLHFMSADGLNLIGTMRGKLAEIEEMLAEHGFVRIHQSFLINMKYIKKISGYRLELEQKITLNIPKKRYRYVQMVATDKTVSQQTETG